MKKFLLLLLILLVVIGISSCQSKENDGTPTDAPTTDAPTDAPVVTDPPATVDPCADGHEGEEWIMDVSPTKAEAGKKHQICKHCGATTLEEEIPATGSLGLAYAILADEKSCTITGRGSCTDTELYVPQYINGYRVVGISSLSLSSKTKKVVIPDSVQIIGEKAFERSVFLTTVVFGENSELVLVGKSAFFDCEKLTDIVLPAGTSYIDDYAFAECSSLKTFTVPSGVKGIGKDAFRACTGLESFVVPENVVFLDTGVFSDCTNLKSVVLPTNLQNIPAELFGNCESLEEVRLPAQFQAIGKEAFRGCISLKEISLPSGVIEIQEAAFMDCTGLSVMNLPSSVTIIGWKAFMGCTGLSMMIIPSSVTIIEASAFENCKGLLAVMIPASVTRIGSTAFANCIELVDVVILNPAVEMGDNVFFACNKFDNLMAPIEVLDHIDVRKLRSLILVNGTAIPNSKFESCLGLEQLLLPGTIKEIGHGAFNNCISLKEIYYAGDEAAWNQITVKSMNTNFTKAKVYFYSETRPTAEGNYWHLVDGVPTPW